MIQRKGKHSKDSRVTLICEGSFSKSQNTSYCQRKKFIEKEREREREARWDRTSKQALRETVLERGVRPLAISENIS